MGVGLEEVRILESSQAIHSFLPSFPPSANSKTNWDSSTNSILLLGVLI